MAKYLDKNGITTLVRQLDSRYDAEGLDKASAEATAAANTAADNANTAADNANAAADNANAAVATIEATNLDAHMRQVAPLIMNGAQGWVVKLKAGVTLKSPWPGNGCGDWDLKAKASEDTWLRQDGWRCGWSASWAANATFANILAVAYANMGTKANNAGATSLNRMFGGFSRVTSLPTEGFDTSSCTDMGSMFFSCSSLTSLDVSSFDTSSVTDMDSMFRYCSSLTSLDVSSFDTSSVTTMRHMFSYCSSLTSLDVSSFDTSSVTTMLYMFSYCSSLTSLDVSSFDTSSVTTMLYMFFSCSSLRYITLGAKFFNTTTAIPFSDAANLGLNADGTDNGWLAHVAETAPTITDGTARTISLPTKLKALSTSADLITQLQEKGYTVA